MRALILSDTHGYVGKLQDALYDAGDCDVIVHLGDGVRDLSALRGYVHADVLAVRGNNDLFAGDVPDSRVVTVGKYGCSALTATSTAFGATVPRSPARQKKRAARTRFTGIRTSSRTKR